MIAHFRIVLTMRISYATDSLIENKCLRKLWDLLRYDWITTATVSVGTWYDCTYNNGEQLLNLHLLYISMEKQCLYITLAYTYDYNEQSEYNKKDTTRMQTLEASNGQKRLGDQKPQYGRPIGHDIPKLLINRIALIVRDASTCSRNTIRISIIDSPKELADSTLK